MVPSDEDRIAAETFGVVEEVDGVAEPAPELAPAVDEWLESTALTVADPADQHEVMVVLDNHDVAKLLTEIQGAALRKWVYEIEDGGIKRGLTVHAVQDITQRMNWTGRCSIGVLPETLSVERIVEDRGYGPEPFWVATIFARDGKTGQTQPGVSMEPVMMRLTPATAQKKRDKGAVISEDRRVFDVFSRTKAVQKATRNAQAAFIPEEIEQTVIAMFARDPSRVERIQTEAEAKVAELPPPLADDQAKEQIAECQALYDEIRECGGGQGKVKFPPGQFAAWMLQSQHDHDALARLRDYLAKRLDELPGEIEREALQHRAAETANEVPCPVCNQPRRQFCKGVRGAHPERVAARLAVLGKL